MFSRKKTANISYTWYKSLFSTVYGLYKMDIFFYFFQVDALRWRALAQQAKDESQCIHFKVLFEALKGLEKQWDKDLLSCEEVGNILTTCSY